MDKKMENEVESGIRGFSRYIGSRDQLAKYPYTLNPQT